MAGRQTMPQQREKYPRQHVAFNCLPQPVPKNSIVSVPRDAADTKTWMAFEYLNVEQTHSISISFPAIYGKQN